jgi:hypothetical protein
MVKILGIISLYNKGDGRHKPTLEKNDKNKIVHQKSKRNDICSSSNFIIFIII